MSDLILISGIVSLIVIIFFFVVFFVMATSVGSLKTEMAKISKFMDSKSQETCPHCQEKTGL